MDFSSSFHRICCDGNRTSSAWGRSASAPRQRLNVRYDRNITLLVSMIHRDDLPFLIIIPWRTMPVRSPPIRDVFFPPSSLTTDNCINVQLQPIDKTKANHMNIKMYTFLPRRALLTVLLHYSTIYVKSFRSSEYKQFSIYWLCDDTKKTRLSSPVRS